MCLRLAFVLSATMVLFGDAANAAITYELAFRVPGQSGGSTSEISLRPGETLTGVELLLIERVSGSSVSILGNDLMFAGAGGIDDRFGNLSQFAADLTVFGSDGRFANLAVNTEGGVQDDSLNDANTIAYTAGGNFFDQPGLEANAVGSDSYEASLGTFDIFAPTIGQSVYSLTDVDVASPNFSTFGVGSLETAATASGGSFNSATLSVSAIPEPSSTFCLGLVGTAIALYRRRKSC